MSLIEVVNSENLESVQVKLMPDIEWVHVAQFASTLGAGTWIPTRTGAFWNLKNSWGWMQTKEHHEEAVRAREIAEALTGEAKGWGVGSNARHCLQWAVEKCPTKPNREAIKKCNGIGYYHCNPVKLESASLYDRTSDYWNLMRRLESLKWNEIRPGYFEPIEVSRDERARLADFFQALGGHKLMRNSVWGSALGGKGSSQNFSHGQGINGGFMQPHLETAACIVGRIAWEFTQVAAHETGAYIGITDCIVCDDDKYPDIWKQYGLPFTLKARGVTDIKSKLLYRCGSHSTKRYNAKDRHIEPYEMAPLLKRHYFREYMT